MVQLDIISHKLMIIIGIIMYIFGLIGNILNICVFTIWSRPRRTANKNNLNNRTGNSSLYLLNNINRKFNSYNLSIINSNFMLMVMKI